MARLLKINNPIKGAETMENEYETQTKHKSEKWSFRISRLENEPITVFSTLNGRSICSIIGDTSIDIANARFIVQACNSHYELLEALKKVSMQAGFEPEEEYGKIVLKAIAKGEGVE